jgi:hypothetical protein
MEICVLYGALRIATPEHEEGLHTWVGRLLKFQTTPWISRSAAEAEAEAGWETGPARDVTE